MDDAESRIIKAVHGLHEVKPDPEFEIGLTAYLRETYNREELVELYARFINSNGKVDRLMRRTIWRALAKKFGNGVHISSGAQFKHPETFEIGNGVFIGENVFIQGRFDGKCIISDNTWIGPQSYFDARNLIIEESVGWGPGAKVLGSAHTGLPLDVPIIQTNLEIKPVVIGAWTDVGVNAVILPGVRVGKGSIIGAGAIVTQDVPPFAVMAGVPARFLHWREGHEQKT